MVAVWCSGSVPSGSSMVTVMQLMGFQEDGGSDCRMICPILSAQTGRFDRVAKCTPSLYSTEASPNIQFRLWGYYSLSVTISKYICSSVSVCLSLTVEHCQQKGLLRLQIKPLCRQSTVRCALHCTWPFFISNTGLVCANPSMISLRNLQQSQTQHP